MIAELKEGESISAIADKIWLAGRVVGILDDGFVLQDDSGRVEVSVKGESGIRHGLFSVGDIVEVTVKRETVMENGREVTVYVAQELQVLAPCTTEFFIRKEDPNFLRSIVDLNLKEKLQLRSEIVQKIRGFFLKQGFMEADTPLLVRNPGMEPYLDVFKTEFFAGGSGKSGADNARTRVKKIEEMYLITSPEYALKKLLTAGFEKIFQVAKSFRNKETASSLHNPEFTLLEWYRAYAGYEEIMKDTEQLIYVLVGELSRGQATLSFQGKAIDVTPPWPRLKVKDAFARYAGIPVGDFENPEKFRAAVSKKGYKVGPETAYDDLFFYVFMNEIEPKLGCDRPTILYEYPVSMAALSKICAHDPHYSERFEVYIAGIELANAFTELNDPVEQRCRLEAERKHRQKLGKDDYPVDQNFIRALEFGMPPAGGIALGVDRLIMLLTDTTDIRDVLFFPHQDL